MTLRKRVPDPTRETSAEQRPPSGSTGWFSRLLFHDHFGPRGEQVSAEVLRAHLRRNLQVAAGLLFGLLAVGVAGYHWIGGLHWIDALLNASMILAGMGPVDPMTKVRGKLFASFYAILSGVAFLSIMGIIVAPILHRFMHHLNLETDEDEARTREPGPR